jgi:hypothetical protein
MKGKKKHKCGPSDSILIITLGKRKTRKTNGKKKTTKKT